MTSHDGFTLADLVSYNNKHNEANKENNHDGDNHNNSWNCGEEGPTKDEKIAALRRRQCRNFLTTLFLSQGVPMLVAGDEQNRTQNGNNNTYCQDNELSWISWEPDADGVARQEFTKRLAAFRRTHPIFRRPRYFRGKFLNDSALKDITWYNTAGHEMRKEDWTNHFGRCLGAILCGRSTDVMNDEGELLLDDTFLLVLNADGNDLPFKLPPGNGEPNAGSWLRLLDTTIESGFVEDEAPLDAGIEFTIGARSLALFRLLI